MEAVTDFVFLGSKIATTVTAGTKFKKHFPLETKAMTNLDSVLKSRDITLPTKVPIVKAIVSLGVTYG